MNTTTPAMRMLSHALAGPIYLAPLQLSDISRMTRLQSVVLESLQADEKSFVVRQTRRRFKAVLRRPHFSLGVFAPSGRLVGQAVLAVCSEAQFGVHLTDSPAARLLAGSHRDFCVIHSVLVDPEYRRQGVMTSLLRTHEAYAQALDIQVILTEIVASNSRSVKGFAHRGFQKAGTAVDPTDNTPLIYLQKRLQIGTNPIGNP
jgi:ribosomal protein S18 acetylase RimI-like enzyme